MKQYDYVVLGAGVAGLAFAWYMGARGKTVLVLEKEATAGGLARTLDVNGFRMDFCGHRFHTNNPNLLHTVLNLPGLTMRKIKKKTRIYMFGKYLTYPFELPELLLAMPKIEAVTCVIDFCMNYVKQKISPIDTVTYKDWFIKLYGKKLYAVMCEPYTSKIWGMDPGLLSPDWGDQRFGRPNLIKLMQKSITKLLTMDFSKHTLEDDMLAPDGGNFYYPMRGFQELPDAFAHNAKKFGVDIRCRATLTAVNTKKRYVLFSLKDNKERVVYGKLISTIPLPVFYALQERRSKAVEKALSHIRYMDVIFVYLFVNKSRISNDHWIYFPDPDVPFNRTVEFTNWSVAMAPKRKSCICLDVTCYQGDKTWKRTDKDITEECVFAADRLGYLKRSEVIGTYVKRIRFGYPVYDLGYKERLQTVVSFLETDNVYLLGRTGIFRYNNSDNSIEMALELGKRLISEQKDASIFDYSMKHVSL